MKKTLLTILFALVAMMMPIGVWAQDATITGVTITVDGVEYGTGETAVITPNTTSIIVTVTGENFAHITKENMVLAACGGAFFIDNWDIDTINNTAMVPFPIDYFTKCIEPFEIQYSNDGCSTLIGTGLYAVYDDGLSEEQRAKITGVTITVDGVEYGTGETAVITPNTTSIIVTVTGENLGNATDLNFVQYGPSLGERLNSSAWTIDVENNVATTERISELQYFKTNERFEVMYSNDGQQTWTGTHLFVEYDNGLPKAHITGLTLYVDGVEYGVGDTAIITPLTSSIICNVTGEHFNNIINGRLFIEYAQDRIYRVSSSWDVDTVHNTATYDFIWLHHNFHAQTTPFEIQYSNDANDTYIPSGVYVVYQPPRLYGELTDLVGTYDAHAQSGFNGIPDSYWEVTITQDVEDKNKLWVHPILYLRNIILEAQDIAAVYMLFDETTGSLMLPMGQVIYEREGTVVGLGSLMYGTPSPDGVLTWDIYQYDNSPIQLVCDDILGAGNLTDNLWWFQAFVHTEFTKRDSAVSTELEQVHSNAATNAQKLLRDGQIIILRDGVEYNTLGAKIQ